MVRLLCLFLALIALSSALIEITTSGDLITLLGTNTTIDNVDIILASGGVIVVSGNVNIGGNVTIGNGVTLTGPGAVFVGGDVTLLEAVVDLLDVTGVLYVNGDASVDTLGCGALELNSVVNLTISTSAIVRSEIFMVEGAGVISEGSSLYVYGDTTGGTLTLYGPTSLSGTIDTDVFIQSGAVVDLFAGPITFLRLIDCSGTFSFDNAEIGDDMILREGAILDSTSLTLSQSSTLYVFVSIDMNGVSINGGTIRFESDEYKVSFIGGTYQSAIHILNEHAVDVVTPSTITGDVLLTNIAVLSIQESTTIDGSLSQTEFSILTILAGQTLTVTGDLEQDDGCATSLPVNSTDHKLIINGNAVLGGSLDVLFGSYSPSLGDRILLLSYESSTGSYGDVFFSPQPEMNPTLDYDTNGLYLYFGATSDTQDSDIDSGDSDIDSEESMGDLTEQESTELTFNTDDNVGGDALRDSLSFLIVLVVALALLIIITTGLLIFKFSH